jgi:predicted dehydrogenase
MKQLLQSLKTGELKIAEVPIPDLQPNGLLVRNYYSFISAGTEKSKVDTAKKGLIGKAIEKPEQVKKVLDTLQKEGIVNTYQKVMGRLDSLVPLGYSSAGEVIGIGKEVTGFKVGDFVACAGVGYANHAEVVYVPKNLVAKIPEGVQISHGAATTVGAVAMQGIRQSGVHFGDNVAVIGLGLIGLLTVQMLKAAGCRVLAVDIDDGKVRMAEEMGANYAALDGRDDVESSALECSHGYGMDAVIITAGTSSNRPVELAGQICRKKGKVVVVGAVRMDIPRSPYYEKEIDVCMSCSYGPGRYDVNYEEKGMDYPIGYVRWTEQRNMEHFLRMLQDGSVKLDRMITHTFDFMDAEKAYDVVLGKTGETFIGILFRYDPKAPLNTKIHLTKGKPAHSEKVNLGMIGAGNFARGVLLPALKSVENVVLNGLVTASGSSARSTAEKFGFQYCGSKAEDVIEDQDTNCVLIATRHHMHASQVIKALERDKHVFVEKPLAISPEELTAIIKKWRDSKGHVMVGFNRRFSPAARAIKAFFKGRTAPMVIHYRVNAGAIPTDHWIQDPQQGGGRIIGEVCHFIDLMQYLTDALPVRVYGDEVLDEGQAQAIYDNVSIQIRFGDGSIGSILYLANGDPSFPKEYMEVFCGHGIAVMDDFKEVRLIGKGKSKRMRMKQDKGHKEELRAFVEAVLNGSDMPIPFESMVATTLSTFRILDSLKENRPLDVSISELWEE